MWSSHVSWQLVGERCLGYGVLCLHPCVFLGAAADVRLVFDQYDNGVTGGVISMPDFLARFFPDLLHDVTSDGQGAHLLPSLLACQLHTPCTAAYLMYGRHPEEALLTLAKTHLCRWKHRVPLLQVQQPGVAVVHLVPLHRGLLCMPACRLHLQVKSQVLMQY